MNCSGCGFQLAPDDLFCLSCGTNVATSEDSDSSNGWPVSATVLKKQSGIRCHCGATEAEIGSDDVCNICGSIICQRDDMTVELEYGLALRTHAGRKHWPNEDYGIVDFEVSRGFCYRWLVVSDGVSSAENSHLASELACLTASQSLRKSVQHGVSGLEAVRASILAAQDRVLAIPYQKTNGRKKEPPEATIAIAFLDPETATIGWVGDSRVYSIVKGPAGLNANLLTRDHSYANAMVDLGRMTIEEALHSPDCNAITQSLGLVPEGEQLEPGIRQFPLQGAIFFVACSDGLWNYVHPNHTVPATSLLEIIADCPQHPGMLVTKLVDHANACGGRDNITVAIASLEGAKNE